MQTQRNIRKTLPLVFVALVLVIAATGITAMAAFAMSGNHPDIGGGGMGGDHMRHMMGGGTDSSNATPTVGGRAETVSIRDFTFSPGNVTVPVGASVTWTNYDDAPHSATAKDGSWTTGILNKGETKTITFDKPGDYAYYCTVHPNMVARLQVR